MTQISKKKLDCIGIDVSKDKLDICYTNDSKRSYLNPKTYMIFKVNFDGGKGGGMQFLIFCLKSLYNIILRLRVES